MLQKNATEIQGVSVESLCEEYGTPLYVYDADTIINKFNFFKDSFSVKSLTINYAVKALSNPNILKLFKKLGSNLDTVSIQELQLGLAAGFKPKNIVFTPSGVSHKELEKAIELGAKINVDNIHTLEYIGHEHPNVPICIRFNPHVMAGGNANISVGHIDSKFGISIHQIPLVQRIVDTLNINVEGVHMHTGSDILDVDVFLQAADILFDVAEKFDHLKYIDFGSGFKIRYKEDDHETDIAEFGQVMSERFNAFEKNYGKPLTLMFEPGKFMVSESGYFFVKTNLIKQTTSTIFASVDSGFNHLIRPMFYNAHHEIYNVSNPNGKPRIYTVVGYICESDTFGYNRRINEIKEGDILGFKNAGAYCYSMASNYNSRYRPAEVLIHKGKAQLIRKRETLDDLFKNVVDIDL
ncbi:diaminopimelate decarboxylase [bacterium SCSIO 12643]|nr:diaminopimelate decarboxylase [bacterium SCSIO 12643]